MAVAGESVGGNMTAALALMAKERGDVTFVQRVDVLPGDGRGHGHGVLRPVRRPATTSAGRRMEWFWDAYAPDLAQRGGDHRVAEPGDRGAGRAGCRRRYLCVDEADVLRDEGEAYAAKLRAAGVPVTTVRYDGTVHDFMLLNSLSDTHATRAAIAQATAFLRAALGTD